MLYISFNAFATFMLRAWLLPRLSAAAARNAQMRDELAEQLGREPTADELSAHLHGESAP